MKQVNYLDEDYNKNLRNKVWELLKNGDIEEADKIFSSKLDIHEIMGTWNWLHKILIKPEDTNPISIEYLIKKGVNPILKDEYNIFDRARGIRPAAGLLSDHLPAVVFVQARAHHLSLHQARVAPLFFHFAAGGVFWLRDRGEPLCG